MCGAGLSGSRVLTTGESLNDVLIAHTGNCIGTGALGSDEMIGWDRFSMLSHLDLSGGPISRLTHKYGHLIFAHA